jgi:quercetin dioxygenase-like cupin family protein
MERLTIENPVSGERATWIESARDNGGVRTVGDVEVEPGGGVPTHRHGQHRERIVVLAGEMEVTVRGTVRRLSAGESVVVEPGAKHAWRNPSADRKLAFRGEMVPGHPGFETALRVVFGLGRDGELRASGIPRRFTDLALLAEWDPSLFAVGPRRLLGPLLRWYARRPASRARGATLLGRYDPGAL